MKKLILLLLIPSALYAEGPIFRHKDTFVNQEFDNAYQDIRSLRWNGSAIYQFKSCTVTTSSNTTATSSVDTNLTCSITPLVATSSIAVVALQPMSSRTASATAYIKIVRGTSTSVSGDCLVSYTNTAAAIQGSSGLCLGVDMPGVTTQVTYKTQMKAAASGSIGTCDQTNACDQTIWLLELGNR